MNRVEAFEEDQRYRAEWLGNLHFDNLIWHQSMVSIQHLETHRQAHLSDPDDAIYWRLLLRGIADLDVVERPNDASTRAIWYSAVMSDRLWAMVQGERVRVRGLLDYCLSNSNHPI